MATGITVRGVFIAAFSSHFWQRVTLSWIDANGQPAILMSRNGEASGVVSVDVSKKGIDQIIWIMRPSKLSAISNQPEAGRH